MRITSGRVWILFLIGGAVGVAALLAVVRTRFVGCDLHFTQWKIGRVDLASNKTQQLTFVYTPGAKVPQGSFSLELRGLLTKDSEASMRGCRLTICVKDGERTICTLSSVTQACGWHEPNAGLLCKRLDEQGVPLEVLEAGKLYILEFTMQDPAKVPDGVEAVLYGSFIWRGSPTQLAR